MVEMPFVRGFIEEELRQIEKERSEANTEDHGSSTGEFDSSARSSQDRYREPSPISSDGADSSSETPKPEVILSRKIDSDDPKFPNELKIKAFLFINDLVQIENLENNSDNHKKMIDIFDQSMDVVKTNKGFVQIGLGMDVWPKSYALSAFGSDPENYRLTSDEKIKIFDRIIEQVGIDINDQEKLDKFNTLMKCLQLSAVKKFLKNELNKIKQKMVNSSRLKGDVKGLGL